MARSEWLKGLLFYLLDKYLAAYIYQLIFTAKDLLNTPAVFCLPLFPSFYFPPSIIILFVPTPPGVFLRWPGREETNLNRNGPAGSSMELRVFVRKLFVCRVRALQFCVRNLGDHVRREKRKEREKRKARRHDCGDNRNYGRNFLLQIDAASTFYALPKLLGVHSPRSLQLVVFNVFL